METKMRNLEDIEKDLAAAREALSTAEGTPAEVYSRIVGYYRSVRNWNRGKREEYGERRLYRIKDSQVSGSLLSELSPAAPSQSLELKFPADENFSRMQLLLFVRTSCPGCPPAKSAAGRLGIPVNLVHADTNDGLAEAQRWNVLSTPMAILISPEGVELGRAKDAEAISRLKIQPDTLNEALAV